MTSASTKTAQPAAATFSDTVPLPSELFSNKVATITTTIISGGSTMSLLPLEPFSLSQELPRSSATERDKD